ncbi:MAG: transketolase [Puniceicoccaceae bacterium]
MDHSHTLLAQAANESRGLAMDAVAACSSGHLGLPLGSAEIGAVLFGHDLSYQPSAPRWLNRDRFILSAGHGSMFLYSWLHLAGYDLPIEEVRNFRQLHSKTPGHPEFGETDGVECTTGPLGQGVGNAVGIAISQKMAAARYNTADHTIFNNHVLALAGDGCLQEGVAAEAASLAGHLGLDNLILIYDSNDVTLDAMADKTQSEDTAARFTAYGWDVVTIDGHDLGEISQALANARQANNGKPKFIVAKTLIGKGIPEVAGTAKAHGEGGAKFITAAREALGLPETSFYVSDSVKAFFAEHRKELASKYQAWTETFAAWQAANPELADQLEKAGQKTYPSPEELFQAIPEADPEKASATRASGGAVLNHLAALIPNLVSGSADLHGSTKNYLDGLGDFSRDNPLGRNFFFGIREHAMGAIVNGIAYDGLFLASGATFATFADYMRPSVRLAALAQLHCFHIWTHDSVGVGEDGPTHQPVEITSALRCIPHLDVLRPADSEETAGAFVAAVTRTDGPSGLILSRQNLPQLSEIPASVRREGVLKGGYIAVSESDPLQTIILASGSELQHALKAAKVLGPSTRVVSVPCFERFDRQDAAYRESVLPTSCRRRIAIEAGVPHLWYRYVGIDGKVVGIERFGLSAPGNTVMQELGITAENLVAVAQSL